MTDEIAKLYITYAGRRFRVKVFAEVIGIEHQPGGENRLLSKAERIDNGVNDVTVACVYDTESGAWDYEVLGVLLHQYLHDESFWSPAPF